MILDLTKKNLYSFPDELLDATDIDVLYLDQNHFNELPPNEIGKLSSLTIFRSS